MTRFHGSTGQAATAEPDPGDDRAEVDRRRQRSRPPSHKNPDLPEPNFRRLVMIGLSLAVFQRVTAIITLIYYAPTRLKSAAVENAAPLPANVASGAINVAVPIVESSLVDRTRCRPLPIGGTTGMVVALTTIVLVFGLGPGHPPGIEVAIAPAFLSVCGLVYFIKRVQHDQHGWS